MSLLDAQNRNIKKTLKKSRVRGSICYQERMGIESKRAINSILQDIRALHDPSRARQIPLSGEHSFHRSI